MQLEAIPLVVLLTSTISGALGMGGGLLLMGALAAVLPPAAALALHGALQLVANGYRAYLWREHIAWRWLAPYVAAAALALILALLGGTVVDRELMFILLGAVALGGALLTRGAPEPRQPARTSALSIDRPAGSAACGLVVTASNLAAGVGGPLLDVFFLRSSLGRRSVVATKALTQTLSHVLKIGFVAALAPSALAGDAFSPPLLAASLAATLAGTMLGGRVLERLSERGFRGATRVLVGAIGVLYLARGVLA